VLPIPAPPPLPTCTIGSASATPNPVRRKGNGQLRESVVVTFQGDSCGSAPFQVGVNGLTPPVNGTGGGAWSATIDKSTSGWNVGPTPIAISGGGASAIVILKVES
jgi:hypothetical protein